MLRGALSTPPGKLVLTASSILTSSNVASSSIEPARTEFSGFGPVDGRGSLLLLPFRKMNGLGNDFVVLDLRAATVEIAAGDAIRIADRAGGIGCDQIILMEHSTSADVFMRIINADGSEVEACGNATRCVARLVMSETASGEVSIETKSERLLATGEGDIVTVDMGRPRLAAAEIPLAIATDDTTCVPIDVSDIEPRLPSIFSAANMGNPHAVFFVDDVDAFDLGRFGPLLEHHPLFPQRANISLVGVLSRSHLRQRVWERGAGLTLACGTGACAAAVAAMRAGLTGPSVTVSLPGGDLGIEWRADGHVVMSGPVTFEFDGVLGDYLSVSGAGRTR